MRVLVVDACGVLGHALVRVLAADAGLTLVVAEPSPARVLALSRTFSGAATIEPVVFDRDGDIASALARLKPDVLVDGSSSRDAQEVPAAGRLARAALDCGIPYLGLADAADQDGVVAALDAEAKAKGIAILIGLGGYARPVGAIARKLASDDLRITSLTCAVAPLPSQWIAPQPCLDELWPRRDTDSECRDVAIAPPGTLPMASTRIELADWPLGAAASAYLPHLQTARFGVARLSRWRRWLLDAWHRLAARYAGMAASAHGRWLQRLLVTGPAAETRSGMVVAVTAIHPDGARTERSWHLVADGEGATLVSAMPAALVIRRMRTGHGPAPGARRATDTCVPFEQLASACAQLGSVGIRDVPDPRWPLYRRVLGPAWHMLPERVRALHDIAEPALFEGTATVERGRTLATRIVAALFRMPTPGVDVPVSVRFSVRDGVETWQRTFGTARMTSTQQAGSGRNAHLIVERFGPVAIGLAPVLRADRLYLVNRTCTFLGVPLPSWLGLDGVASEREANGLFHFDVDIVSPLFGSIVHYRGTLAPVAAATTKALKTGPDA